VKFRCRDAEEFDAAFSPEASGGTIFCPTTTRLDQGSQVVVEVACKSLPNRVMIKGNVLEWRPALPRLRVRAGATIRFDPLEGTKLNFVIETLHGERAIASRRKHTRLPVGLPIKVKLDAAASTDAELREISVSGALIAGIAQPQVGTDLVIELVPPGSAAPVDISCKVLYHAGTEGTGLRFVFREGGGSRRLREVVRRFKAG
jgi:Tfp pilus assembly protein PilZ